MNSLSLPLRFLFAMNFALCAGAHGAGMDEWRLLNPYPGTYESDMPPPQPPKARSPLSGAPSDLSLPTVRLAYIIPSNRTAQADAVAKMRAIITDNQNWFRDQFERHGFEPKTFRVETEPDGVTPKVHVKNVPDTDAYLRGDIWSRTIQAASNAGITIWTTGEVWLLVPETHVQAADGSVTGGTALGASFGSGADPGVAMMGSDSLARWATGMFNDDRAYHNLFIPEIGPHALKQDVTFPWFEGTTISSVSSSVRGASTHEMSHAFGLPHDFRNDNNFQGNLMGNGLRGLRGNFFPGRYANDHTRLSYASALALNPSRYFNSDIGETTKPILTDVTTGAVTIVAGRIEISFTASDSSGLVAAWLTRGGDLVGEMPLAGTSVKTQFSTPYFTPGAANSYAVAVFDRFGNKLSVGTTITPASGPNCAPQPSIRIQPPTPLAGETVVLDAGASTDPESGASVLKVEWDLDGDGQFDTPPTTTKTFNLPLPLHGNRYISARITDPSNATAVSTRLALHTHRPPTTMAAGQASNTVDLIWLSKLGFVYQAQRSPNLLTWSSTGLPLQHGNGAVLQQGLVLSKGASAEFYRAVISRANE